MNIFLLGGTKDSVEIIKHLKSNYKCHILTTTTTEYGSKLAKTAGSDETISKPLLKDELIEILKNSKFDIIIDATHPFAVHITQTIIDVSKIVEIPLIRFERPSINFDNIDTSHVRFVNSFDEAGKLIASEYNQLNVLHFAGANTMETLLKYVSVKNFYPRILKVEQSLKKCEKLGVLKNHIIPMTKAASSDENIKLIEKYNAGVIITKESGEIGGVIDKINAANSRKIALIMIQRPEIKELDEKYCITNLEELDEKIKLINAETGI